MLSFFHSYKGTPRLPVQSPCERVVLSLSAVVGNLLSFLSEQISRTTMYLIDLTSTENGISALKDSREVVGESILDPQPLAFSAYFILSEQVRHRFFLCPPRHTDKQSLNRWLGRVDMVCNRKKTHRKTLVHRLRMFRKFDASLGRFCRRCKVALRRTS